MNFLKSILRSTAGRLLSGALMWQPLRRRVRFELTHRYYDEFDYSVDLGCGLECPVQFWEAWASFSHIFIQDEYERAFAVMPAPERWIDIGCYAGYFSLSLALLRARQGMSGKGRALLIDADSKAVGAVGKLIELNQLEQDWRMVPGAIAQTPGTVRFAERSFMTSSLVRSDDSPEMTTEVQVITAEDILARLSPPYDLVKIDIEGGEFDFLLAYEKVLAHTSWLLVEWHGWHPGGGGESQIREMVGKCGFSFVIEVLAPEEAAHRTVTARSGVHLYQKRA